MIEINILNKSRHELPKYSTEDSAGLDLRANIDEPIILKQLQRKLVPTGIYIELPKGHEAQIRPRSGLAHKFGVSIVNSPGTIDADYRGEIKINLINYGEEDFTITDGDRIAQMVVCEYVKVDLKSVIKISETVRGIGGFGHTGDK